MLIKALVWVLLLGDIAKIEAFADGENFGKSMIITLQFILYL